MTKRPNDSRPKCEALELREAPASVAAVTEYRPLDFQLSGTVQTTDTHLYSLADGPVTDTFNGEFRATGRITYDGNGGISTSVNYTAQGDGTIEYQPAGDTTGNSVSIDFTATETGTLSFKDVNGVWTTTSPFIRTSNRAVGGDEQRASRFERATLGPSGVRLNFDPSTMQVSGGWASQNGINATSGSLVGNVTQPGAGATDLSVSNVKLYESDEGFQAKFDVGASGALMSPPDKTSPGAIARVFWADGTGRMEDSGTSVNVAWNAGKVSADVTGLEAPEWATAVKVVVEANGWTESATLSNNAGAIDLGSAIPPVDPTSPPPPPAADPTIRKAIPGTDRGGDVFVYGADNALKFTIKPYGQEWKGSISTATGDVTGDGVQDIITGAGFNGGPHVKIFDGVTGKELESFYAFDEGFRGGVNVAAGDMNGDGRAEIIVGAGLSGGPHVKVFDGLTRQLRRNFFAFDATQRSGVTVAAGDLNNDGKAELVTGTGPGELNQVRVFGNANDTPISSFAPYSPNMRTGAIVGVVKLEDGRTVIMTGADLMYHMPISKFDITGKPLS